MNSRLLWAVVLGTAACTSGSGQTAAKSSEAKPEVSQSGSRPVAQKAATAEGVRGAIDPATQKLRQPTAEEMKSLAEQSKSRKSTGTTQAVEPQILRGPDGAIGLRLGEDSMSYAVATKTPDGKISFDCVTGKGVADEKVKAAKEQPKVTGATKGAVDGR